MTGSTDTHAQTKRTPIAEGKTKIILQSWGLPNSVDIISKDDITAGDGAKHDRIQGKATLATETTCNVFRLLKACGIPVAFTEQVNSTTFSAPLCTMLPYEVVVRREAHGSYLKRMPWMTKGHLFPQVVVEFFLKTNGKKWKEHTLPCDDPLMVWRKGNGTSGTIDLYEPSKPMQAQLPFLTLNESEVFGYPEEWKLFESIEKTAKRAFLVLEKAWQLEKRKLVDFKVEFGLTKSGTLLLADVIDNDSWRVIEDGVYIDKQVYRDGGALDDVAEKYRRVAEVTKHFSLPQQQIIIWRGSERDIFQPVIQELAKLCEEEYQHKWPFRLNTVACSMHKDPVRGLDILNQYVQEMPDTVVIAYIGRSNGAGPTLSASTTVPVITVPANFKDFPEDTWSSLRTPSSVPVMTVLEPSNAALAALGILALRNPFLYMLLREKVEERLVNTIELSALSNLK